MTEKSYLWDGTVTGDATIAPYNREEFNIYMFLLQATDNTLNNAYVIPGYLNDLRVNSDETGMTINVASGAAVMGGRYIFTSDENVSLAIEPIQAADHFRYDYIVLRLDVEAQTIRLVVVQGAEVSSESELVTPTLTQNVYIREIPLAQLYVDDLTEYVRDRYIYDMRRFTSNAFSNNSFKLSDRNLVVNSEFMAFGDDGGSITVEGWNGPVVSSATKLTPMSRGQSASVDSTPLSGGLTAFWQIVPIYPNIKTYTVKGVFKDTVGGTYDGTPGGSGTTNYVALYPCTLNGTIVSGQILYTEYILPGTYKRQEYTSLEADTEVEFQFTITLDDNSAVKALRLEFGTISGIMEVGQVILVPGYHPGPFRCFRETIMYRAAKTAAAWSDSAKSSGTTTIDLATSYGIPEKTRGVYVRVRGRDSGSAGGVASLAVQGYAAPYNEVYGTVELDGINNDVYREGAFYVPTDAPLIAAQDGTPQLRAIVVATGAGTFDATLEVIGIDT